MREAGPIAALVALAVVKLWPLVTPIAASRLYLGGDFGLAVEPHFYHELKRGLLPLWDPTLGTGSPFLGGGTHHPKFLQSHLHLFYPLNLLLALAERGQHIPHLVLQYHHVVHYALAGVFTYAYARQLGLGRFAGCVSGVAFMFSGFMLAHITHWTMIDTIVWLPATLACVVRADVTGHPLWGALGGLVLGIAFLAGHPQLFYHVALVTLALGLTLIARRATTRRPWGSLALILSLVPLVAFGISAIQLVPSWEMAVSSQRAQHDYDWKVTYSFAPAHLLQVFLPWGLRPATEGARSVSSEFYAYPGVLPLVLAVHTLARRWDWRVGFHATIGFITLLLAFGEHFGLYRAAYDFLPGLSFFRAPARFVGVASFTVAVLAGTGAHALVTGPRPRRLARALRRLVLIAAVGGVPLALVLVWARSQPNAGEVQLFASRYVLLALFLGGTALVVNWIGRVRPGAVRAGFLIILLGDLLFGSSVAVSAARNPDNRPAREREWVEAISRTPEPLRLARGAHLHPQVLYRHGWGVVDGESAFAPSAFLDLYALSGRHPRLLDLLNVRYVLPADHQMPRGPAVPEPPVRVWDGGIRRFGMPAGVPIRQLEIHSHLVHGLELPQGRVVATVYVIATDGVVTPLRLRAGIETAEWALDRPGGGGRHERPVVARSWSVTGGYRGHTYRATLELPKGIRGRELVLQGGSDGRGPTAPAVLVVERITADGTALWPAEADPGGLRLVTEGLYENTRALPRAFLVRHARSVPSANLLEQLQDLDPREEVLISDPLPPGWHPTGGIGGTPLPAVRVVRYRPDHVVLDTETPEPAVLVLSDTFDRRWRAWDNGQSVPIVRANHALRSVFLTPGRHQVEFRYAQPAVFVGLGLTVLTLALLAVAGLSPWRRRRRAAHPA